MKKMVSPAMALAGLMGMTELAVGSDDMIVFSDFSSVVYGTTTFNNGWQDNGWGPRFNTNNPTHSGNGVQRTNKRTL